MHGPPLTPAEVIGRISHHVAAFEAAGLPFDSAVVAAGVSLGVDPSKIAALLSEPAKA